MSEESKILTLVVSTAVMDAVQAGRCSAVVGEADVTYKPGYVVQLILTGSHKAGNQRVRVTHVTKHIVSKQAAGAEKTLPILSVLRELAEGEDAVAESLQEVKDVPFQKLVVDIARYSRLPATVLSEGGLPSQAVIPSKLAIDTVPEGTPFPEGTKMPVGFVVSFIQPGIQVDVPAALQFDKLQVIDRDVDKTDPVEPDLSALTKGCAGAAT